MKIKRFVGSNMRRILQQVREEQGPDAVILANRRIDDGIEVIAAVDYDEALMQQALQVPAAQHAARERAQAETRFEGDFQAALAVPDDVETEATEGDVRILAASLSRKPLLDDATPPAGDERLVSIDTLRSELHDMRGMLEAQLATVGWNNLLRNHPAEVQVFRNLTRLGVAPDVCKTIADRIGPVTDSGQVWHKPLQTLANLVPLGEPALLEQGGVAALIGPTGVGKTTTIAKIATRYAMRHGTRDIALISADARRLGAQEQLATFAGILGVKVHEAAGPEDIADILHDLRGKKLVLIDTEGCSQRDRNLAGKLAAYGRLHEEVDFYLTLAANCQEAGLDETVRTFGAMPLSGAIVTKIDEAAQLGCVLSALIRHDLEAGYLCDGQHVPDDLHSAARKRLWLVNKAIECMRSSAVRVDDLVLKEKFGIAEAVHA